MPKPSLLSLLQRVHEDEEGTVSLETILIVAAIALPILLWLSLKGWPMVKEWFKIGIDDLKGEGREEIVQ